MRLGLRRESVFCRISEQDEGTELELPPRAKRHRWKDSWSDEPGRRSDPTNACIRASAEKDTEQRSHSKGRNSSSEREQGKMTFSIDDSVVEKQYQERRYRRYLPNQEKLESICGSWAR